MKKLICRKLLTLLVICSMIASVMMFATTPASAAGTTYYVDSVNGSDADSGMSSSTAWQTLSKVNATTFNPGDKILFKAGGIWNGQLSSKGSGASGSPIIIDMYGTGSKPVINGGGLNNTGTVYLVNQEYWEINNLEITNDDNFQVNNTTNVRMGIYYKIDANISGNNRVFNHIYIQNSYIHDVDGNENGSASAAGISGEIIGPSTASLARFNDVHIVNNTFTKVDRTAIQPVKLNIFSCPGTDSCFRDGVRNNNQWSTNVYIGYNTMSDIGGDGILMRETKDAIVEHNVLGGFGTRVLPTVAVAGIWLWNANHTVFQFNEVYGGPANNQDGMAFDFDYYGIDNVYQYNYSHDNPMGSLLIMGNNEHDVFRYNISQNDGYFIKWMPASEITASFIYNNIYYYDGANTKPSKETTMKSGLYLYNNIFYNHNASVTTDWGSTNWKNTKFSNNLFYEKSGSHSSQEPSDPGKLTSDPQLVNPGSGGVGISTLDGYKLQSGSPAMNAGKVLSSNGGEDFWGNSLYYGAPDIGAFESPSGGTLTPAPEGSIEDPSIDPIKVTSTFSIGQGALSNIVDGDLYTSWASGRTPVFPGYITIDYGVAKTIDRVTLATWFAIGQGITNVGVEYDNGGIWSTAAPNQSITWLHNDNTVEQRDISFNSITTSKIRLKVNSANTLWGNFALSELFISAKVTGISLDKSDLFFNSTTEPTASLTATVLPADASNKQVRWSTTNSHVATVDGKGVVTAVGEGKATIFAMTEDGNFQSFSNVIVDWSAPVITIDSIATTKDNTGDFKPQFTEVDELSGVDNTKTVVTLDGNVVMPGDVIALYTLKLGTHTLMITSSDLAGNLASKTVTFQVETSFAALEHLIKRFAGNDWIDSKDIANSLLAKLEKRNLESFINELKAQNGKHISANAANYLQRDAEALLSK